MPENRKYCNLHLPEDLSSLYPDNREKECYFFFVEIQNVEGWKHFVRRLIDTTDIHVILTGSSSKMLATEMESTMRGRSISKEVLPFSFVEFLKYHHVFKTIPEHLSDDDIAHLRHEMDRYFHIGGFPEIYKYSDLAARIEILQEYSDLVVLKDVIERHEVSNVTARLKTGYVNRILSLNSLAPDIVEAILAGAEPDGLSITKLTEQPIPEDWNEQRRLYGFPER